MNELTSTRFNELIDPNLHIWSWEIAIYLFIGGLVAGLMIISGYFVYIGRYKTAKCACLTLPLYSIIILSLGMFALFLDLEHKWYFWRMYMTFNVKSPMSWGSWILLLVYPALIANMMLKLPVFISKKIPLLKKWSEKFNRNDLLIKYTGIANIVLGGMLGIYTGILLSAFGARPLWNSPLLAVIFLISGLSSAAAFVYLISKDDYEKDILEKTDNKLIVFELITIILFIIGLLTSTDIHINAAGLILNGPYAAQFWVLVVGLGLVIPLFLQIMSSTKRISHNIIAPVLVLAGGLFLRFVIVYAGQYSHWTNHLFNK